MGGGGDGEVKVGYPLRRGRWAQARQGRGLVYHEVWLSEEVGTCEVGQGDCVLDEGALV